MPNLTRRTMLTAAALVGLAASLTLAHAQNYPDRPLRIIVPYAAGGASDTNARLIAQRLERDLGQPLVVDNRGGGASIVGTQAIANAPPDGYTLGVIDSAFTINVTLFKDKLPYDTRRDFAPVSLLTTSPLVLIVHPDVPVKTVAELIALAKAKPGQVTFGSAGLGTSIHLGGEQIRQVGGVDIVSVPYRGGAPALLDLLAGKLTCTFQTVPAITEHVQQGRARALAVIGERVPQLPGVPTMAEAGYGSVNAVPAFGLIAPAATPPAIVARLSQLASNAVKTDPLRARLVEIGFTPIGNTPEEFRAFNEAEIEKWGKVITAGSIKPE
jgi:tripartite-type tricarboxylate transporter receptor subunit TctC